MICHAGAHFYVVREKKGEKKKKRTVHRLTGPTAWPANSSAVPDG